MKRARYLCSTAFAVGLVTLVGCIPPGNKPNPVDHETTRTKLEDNSVRISEGFAQSATFLEDSDILEGGASAAGTTSDCSKPSSGSSGSSCSSELNYDLASETERTRKDVVDGLNKNLFKEKNIVSDTGTSITYKVPGRSICTKRVCSSPSDGNPSCDRPTTSDGYGKECLKRAEKMKYRVRVTSPRKEMLKFELMVGPNRHKPVVFELGPNKIAAEAHLGAIRKSVKQYDKIYGTDSASDMPSTFDGSIRAMLERLGPKKSHFETRITSSVKVGGSDYSLSLPAGTKPVFGWTADGKAEKLTTTVDFPTIDASFPYTYYDSTAPSSGGGGGSSSGSADQGTTLQHEVHIAGITAKSIYEGGAGHLDLERVGLGNATSWLKMAGKKVLSVDLNKTAGRTFSAKVEPAQNGDAVRVEVEPKFDLRTMLKFRRISEKLESLPKWSFDDRMMAQLSGANPSSLVFGSDGIEVVRGVLELESSSAGITHRVTAGQCLVGVEPMNQTKAEPHPLEYYAAGSCKQN